MKAASVELEPRAVFSVVLGVTFWMSVRSTAPILSSLSALNAVTAIGTLCSVSDRRRAVTTMSPLSWGGVALVSGAVSAAALCGASAGAVCAIAGVANSAAALAPSLRIVDARRFIAFPS